MTALPDPIAQSTLWGLDDTRARKEKLRKVMAPKVEPAIPSGDCCAWCRHWTAPEDGDAFGLCGLLVVVTARSVDGPEKGAIVSRFVAIKGHWEFEELSTKGFLAGCSVFSTFGY